MSLSNNFPAIKPSLMLDFANTGSLDPRVSFARASTATYYDGVTTAKAEQNLLTYSQEFDNAAWAKEYATVTANTLAAPDGTTTADTLAENTSTSLHRTQSSYISFTSGQTYTFSVYAKNGDRNFVQLFFPSAFSTSDYANFDISTGVLGTVGGAATASIVNVGSGWYRCIVTVTATSTASGAPSIALITSATSSRAENYLGTSKFIYLWGAQLEQRSAVSSYTPTTTQPIVNYIPVLQTAASGVARFDHNPTTGEALGLLIEEQRTNLLTYSSDYSNAAWTKTTSTVTSNAIIAPDGTLTGNKLIVDNTQTSGYLSESNSYTSGSAYTFSCYAKQGEQTDFRIITPTSAFGAPLSGVFNLATGTVTSFSASSASIQSVGNGWYRCSITATATVTTTGFLQLRSNYTGNGYSGIYIWGAQLEAGAFPTSAIQTTSAQVTRLADQASMTGTNFSSWYNQGEGTVYFESETAQGNNAYPFSLFGSSTSNRIFSNYTTVSRMTSGVRVNGTFEVAVNTPDSSAPINTFGKGATAYKVNDFGFSWNGAAALTDTSTTLPTVQQLDIGNNGALVTNWLNGHIRKISYYQQRLSNANLQALTS